MEKKILNEIIRINTLMGGENILSEQVSILPKVLKTLFTSVDDDIARKVLRSTDESMDGLIKQLRSGQKLAPNTIELLLRVIDYDLLAKTFIDQKLLGNSVNKTIEDIIDISKENPEKYDEIVKTVSEYFEELGEKREYPYELITSLKKDVISKIDDGVKIKKVLLGPKELDKLNAVVKSETVETFAGDIIRYWKASVEDIQKEIQGLSEGFIESMKGAKKKDREKLINAYGAKISRLLDRAEIKQNGAAAKVLQDSGIDEKLVNKIKFSQEPFFEVYRRARGIDNETFTEIMLQTSKEFIVEIWDLIRGLFRKEANTLIRMINPKKSVGQWFITNQWASINKLYRLAIKMSPGESQTKLLRYLGATMFASSVGFVIGQLLKSGLQGLNDLYGVGLRNILIDKFAGEDGMIFGKDVGQYKKDLPEFGGATNLLGELGKPLDAIGKRIFDDVIKSYNEKGFKDVILRAVPGGILTYPESLFFQIFEYLTPLEGNVPNLRNAILKMMGYDPQEVEDTLSELESTETQLEYTLDAVRNAAPENVRPYIWKNKDNIFLRMEKKNKNSDGAGILVDYKITIENGEYIVDMGTPKKLKDIK